MSWRTVVITGHTKLDYKMDYLVIRKANETKKIHLSEIGVLLIESTAVSLTTMLLSELSKWKVKVIFCDEKHNPQSEVVTYYGSHNTSGRIREQVKWNEDTKALVWTEIVRNKILQQAQHLGEKEHLEEALLLESYANSVQERDVTNREGHAAKVYFNALFGMGFSRSDKLNSINAALDYGYGIMLSMFNKEIVLNGYITQLGIGHDNMFNKFNLGSDLMEPFRILIDKYVIGMGVEKFDSEEKHELIKVLSDSIYMDGKRQYIPNAVAIYCKSVFDAICSGDVSQLIFYKDEL